MLCIFRKDACGERSGPLERIRRDCGKFEHSAEGNIPVLRTGARARRPHLIHSACSFYQGMSYMRYSAQARPCDRLSSPYFRLCTLCNCMRKKPHFVFKIYLRSSTFESFRWLCVSSVPFTMSWWTIKSTRFCSSKEKCEVFPMQSWLLHKDGLHAYVVSTYVLFPQV